MNLDQLFNIEILILLIITGVWCFLHSFLISKNVYNFFKKKLADEFRYYRISYNIFSLFTLICVLVYEIQIRQVIVFQWNGVFRTIQIVLFILAIIIFYLGAKQYSFLEFIGLNQINYQTNKVIISHSGELNISGIHKIVRHPWYLGTLIIIWLRNLSVSVIWMNIIFSIYLLVGSYLEERKLVLEFGPAYKNYQKNVSMLIPVKWIFRKKVTQ